jgi:hypothetical protein
MFAGAVSGLGAGTPVETPKPGGLVDSWARLGKPTREVSKNMKTRSAFMIGCHSMCEILTWVSN